MNDLTEYWRNMPADEFKRTSEALEASIKHWEENAEAEKPEDVSMSSDDCALCRAFYLQRGRCTGCPVDRVSKAGCMETPFEHASMMFREWERGMADIKAFQKATQKELDFLKSLRPSNWGRTE